MSTRANIIIQSEREKLYFYRHSDGYPECCGEDLKEFVKGYQSGAMRNDVMQSAGWLIVRGWAEYAKDSTPSFSATLEDHFSGWKVGAYEPTTELHCDVEYIYIIDLNKSILQCREPKDIHMFSTKPMIENTKAVRGFKAISFRRIK